VNASTDDVGPAANGLEYAIDLDDGGHDVEVFLDGAATRWAGRLESKPDHPVGEHFEEAEERGLIAGACGYCADAFDATEGVEARDIGILAADEHGPGVGELAETHNLLTIG
jgi:hypothetical protein